MKYLAIHHTDSYATKNQLYAVNRYHRNKWNFISSLGWYVGYNYFIDYDGTITNTRKVGEATAAQIGHNCNGRDLCDTISVCLSGDFNMQLPNEKQKASLKALYGNLSLDHKDLEITTHRDLQKNRTCPGDRLTDQRIKEIIEVKPKHKMTPDEEKQLLIKELSQIEDTYEKFLRLFQWVKSKGGLK